jgi:hypothetical protein
MLSVSQLCPELAIVCTLEFFIAVGIGILTTFGTWF